MSLKDIFWRENSKLKNSKLLNFQNCVFLARKFKPTSKWILSAKIQNSKNYQKYQIFKNSGIFRFSRFSGILRFFFWISLHFLAPKFKTTTKIQSCKLKKCFKKYWIFSWQNRQNTNSIFFCWQKLEFSWRKLCINVI